MKFVIFGIPIPQARPRFLGSKYFGKTPQVYDPNNKQKAEVKKILYRQMKICLEDSDIDAAKIALEMPSNDFFHVDMKFYMPLQASDSRAKRNMKLWGFSKHTAKPDLDNLEKFYLDCLTGIFFDDDAKVTSLTSQKMYSCTPKTEITILGKKEMDTAKKSRAMSIFSVMNPSEFEGFFAACNEISKMFDTDLINHGISDEKNSCSLERCAFLLGYIAENYSDTFSKMKKKHREFCVANGEI